MARSRVFIGQPTGGSGPPAADPFIPARLPDPVRRKQRGEFTVSAGLLLTTLAVAATSDVVVRGPLFTRIAAKPAAQVVQVPNLLGTTLAPAAAAASPFGKLPEYRRPGLVVQQPQVGPNLLAGTLAPAGEVAAPFVPPEFSVPRAREVPQPQDWQRLLGTTLAQVAAPFLPVDLCQPQGRKQGQHETPQSRLALTFVQPPFVTPDLPQPGRSKFSPQTWDRASWFVLLGKPVTQASLEVPVRRRAQDTGSTASGLALTTQVTPQGTPFVPAMQQNPAARRAAQVQYEANRLPIVSFVAPVGTPFSQHEWITPPAVRYSPTRHDLQVNLLALGIPEPGAVGSADEWIIRARRRGRR